MSLCPRRHVGAARKLYIHYQSHAPTASQTTAARPIQFSYDKTETANAGAEHLFRDATSPAEIDTYGQKTVCPVRLEAAQVYARTHCCQTAKRPW